ncbi:unnamed protein product [Ectocarpus sp. 12 AP-2014]
MQLCWPHDEPELRSPGWLLSTSRRHGKCQGMSDKQPLPPSLPGEQRGRKIIGPHHLRLRALHVLLVVSGEQKKSNQVGMSSAQGTKQKQNKNRSNKFTCNGRKKKKNTR